MGPAQSRPADTGVGPGTVLLLVGVALLGLQTALSVVSDPGRPGVFGLGCLAVLSTSFGTWLGRPQGLLQRLLVTGALVWIVGWIAVAPALTAGGPSILYAMALLIGGLLCFAGSARWLASTGSLAEPSLPEAITSWRLVLTGFSFAAPASLGLVAGPDVAVLFSVIFGAVAVILLYLVRPR